MTIMKILHRFLNLNYLKQHVHVQKIYPILTTKNVVIVSSVIATEYCIIKNNIKYDAFFSKAEDKVEDSINLSIEANNVNKNSYEC